jgi:predicted RND superfamily exporter protein
MPPFATAGFERQLMRVPTWIVVAERTVFGARPVVVLLFLLITAAMAYSATNLRIDAGFAKLLPLKHPYMQTFLEYQEEFGGANRVLIALTVPEGDIFTPEFFAALKGATDDTFFVEGVDRSRVKSIFTPNVRFTEVVEDGIEGGNVVPADFQPTPEGLAAVRDNILKAGILGRLVANDFSGAIVSAQLLEVDPNTGQRLDFVKVSQALEDQIRDKYQSESVDVGIAGNFTGIQVHIIGFAKVIGDITEGAGRVVVFFGVAFLITALLVYLYSMSLRVTLIPLACSLMAVTWQLGLLPLLGFGIDPMSILVPFLVFAIGVSHGVQMISAVGSEVYQGSEAYEACCSSFRRLLIPGGIALASDTIGFITILLIDIDIIQEMAITASLGVAVIILTNLILLPVLLSYLTVNDEFRARLHRRAERSARLWRRVAVVSKPAPAAAAIMVAVLLLGLGLWKGTNVAIGDLHSGVPELREDSRYNIDAAVITDRFSVGVDVLSVIAEAGPEGCIDFEIMTAIDRFVWHIENVEGVQSVISLPTVAKVINAGWNEGSPKWRALPRNPQTLVQDTYPVDTSSGLLNKDCSVMPVLVFTSDHKADTIKRIVAAVKAFDGSQSDDRVKFRLATGNVGVMAATNEAVEAAQYPMLGYVFGAIIVLCAITFRSLLATLCIVLPLALVSLLAYALMNTLQIGLKVNTLPVVALGVGIGVDYGIYIYARFQSLLEEGLSIYQAYLRTLAITGSGVVFTGVTLAIGVATWIFSPLKFQADMGILLTFMFLVNMLGAILLLPALAKWLLRPRPTKAAGAT